MRKGKVFSLIRTETVIQRTRAGTYTRTNELTQNTLDLTQDETVRTGTVLATVGRNAILQLQLNPLKSSLSVIIVNNQDIIPLTA